MDASAFNVLAWTWTAIGVLVFPLTLSITPPFGRHSGRRFGLRIANRLGWLVMESPALWCFVTVFLQSVPPGQPVAWLLACMWMGHYINRGLMFPLRTRTAGKQIPLLVVLSGFGFQVVNGSLNGLALGQFGEAYTQGWLSHPVVWVGIALFLSGWCVNLWSDEVLLRLRLPGEQGYRIPYGGLFEWVSCPNFLGEMVQWFGWALICWNVAALSFAVWTIANLLPRALAHHRWYQEQFPDYPRHRRAVIPGLL